jgi:peptidyl-prolyl cis-trans isomerase SurA
MGKKMKKGPTSFQDVRTLVLQDYQKDNVTSITKQLRKKYRVEIYSNVLKTVNNDGRI